MAWNIEIDPAAKRQLDKLDRQVSKRILSFLFERLAFVDNRREVYR